MISLLFKVVQVTNFKRGQIGTRARVGKKETENTCRIYIYIYFASEVIKTESYLTLFLISWIIYFPNINTFLYFLNISLKQLQVCTLYISS